jgi:hypothetical protein
VPLDLTFRELLTQALQATGSGARLPLFVFALPNICAATTRERSYCGGVVIPGLQCAPERVTSGTRTKMARAGSRVVVRVGKGMSNVFAAIGHTKGWPLPSRSGHPFRRYMPNEEEPWKP